MKFVFFLMFVLTSWNSMAQKYRYMDRDCDVYVVAYFNHNRDSVNLRMDLTNRGKLSIFFQSRFKAQWTYSKEELWITFGDDAKMWRESEYSLRQVKPDETVHLNVWVKNFFTDSTSITFGGACIIVPTPKENKVYSNLDFQDFKSFKDFGFVFYPTFKAEGGERN